MPSEEKRQENMLLQILMKIFIPRSVKLLIKRSMTLQKELTANMSAAMHFQQ